MYRFMERGDRFQEVSFITDSPKVADYWKGEFSDKHLKYSLTVLSNGGFPVYTFRFFCCKRIYSKLFAIRLGTLMAFTEK